MSEDAVSPGKPFIVIAVIYSYYLILSGTFCYKSIQQGPRGFIWDGRWRTVIRRCAQISEQGMFTIDISSRVETIWLKFLTAPQKLLYFYLIYLLYLINCRCQLGLCLGLSREWGVLGRMLLRQRWM